MTGGVEIPDNLGSVTIDLNEYAINGADGTAGDDITAGGNGESALKIVPPTYACEAGETKVTVSGSGTLNGGNGGNGHPQGRGAPAVAGSTTAFDIATTVTQAVAVPTKVTEPTLMTVPAGFGFWYEKKQD